MDSERFRPIKLVKNESYSTYQLWAVAKGKSDLESAMTISILTTLAWLRTRFRDFTIPEALLCPEPDRYNEVQLSDFRSLQLHEGYNVEIVSLPEEKIWALELEEPDFGSDPGNPDQARKPVAGRMFETNIAFRIYQNRLECGFQTIVRDPVGSSPCEVYRPSVVKLLARNPLVGLSQIYPLREQLHDLPSLAALRRLKEYLRDRDAQLPAVLFLEYMPEEEPIDIKPPKEWANVLPFDPIHSKLAPLAPASEPRETPKVPYNPDVLVRYKMGFAHFFVLRYADISEFNRMFQLSAEPGDICMMEPDNFGGKLSIWSYQKNNARREIMLKELEQLISNYPMRKPVQFGNILFCKQAKLKSWDGLTQALNSQEEIIRKSQEREQLLELSWSERLRISEERNGLLEDKIKRLQDQSEDMLKQMHALRSESERTVERNSLQLREMEKEIEYYKSLRERPERADQVPAWVEKRFAKRLIFHPRARELITETPTNEIDLRLLCDALEYLATEYRDKMEGEITEEELLSRCSKKYNRPFEVVPVGTTTIEYTPSEYKIKYYIGFKGKPIESDLNLHLRVGTDAEKLLRIYFLYDTEKRLVVVGSLPKHLRTVKL